MAWTGQNQPRASVRGPAAHAAPAHVPPGAGRSESSRRSKKVEKCKTAGPAGLPPSPGDLPFGKRHVHLLIPHEDEPPESEGEAGAPRAGPGAGAGPGGRRPPLLVPAVSQAQGPEAAPRPGPAAPQARGPLAGPPWALAAQPRSVAPARCRASERGLRARSAPLHAPRAHTPVWQTLGTAAGQKRRAHLPQARSDCPHARCGHG